MAFQHFAPPKKLSSLGTYSKLVLENAYADENSMEHKYWEILYASDTCKAYKMS